MKYGVGLALAPSSRIPRRSSVSSAASPAGLAAPPPEAGSTRVTGGGAAAIPGALVIIGVLGVAAVGAQPALKATTTGTAIPTRARGAIIEASRLLPQAGDRVGHRSPTRT